MMLGARGTVASLVAGLLGYAAGWSIEVNAATLPDGRLPDCLAVQMKPDNFKPEVMDKAKALGFRIIRKGVYWNGVEKEKGVYDFSAYDVQMAHAKELGLTVIGTLFSGNKLYEGGDKPGGILTADSRKGFAAFAVAAAQHYKDQPVLWEIWNEPNVSTFWGKHGKHNTEQFATEYSALVNEVAPAMVKAVPDCFVMAGSVSNYWEPSYQWTEFCFQKGVLKSGIRGWSVHPYGVKTPEEFAIGHQRTRELLAKYGAPDMPMLDTERGFAAKEREEGWSGGSKEKAQEFQAWNLVRQFMIDRVYDVKLTSWYEWGGNEGFALMDKDTPTPACTAFKAMVEQLNGYKYASRVASDSKLDYLLLFQDKAGNRKLVAWTAPAQGGSPDEFKEHQVIVETRPADAKGVTLTLTGTPQYVTVAGNVELVKSTSVQGPQTASPAPAAAAPAGGTDLKLFEGGANWTFAKNTGEGSIGLGKDDSGKPIGIVQYDFSKSNAKTTPYVLASIDTNIAEGAKQVSIMARSSIAQPLTFRLVDSAGQTLQYKGRIKGNGSWEAILIPLTGKLEHWGGDNDGRTHFPIRSLVLSIPLPNADQKTGKVEFADASAVGSAVTPKADARAPAPATAALGDAASGKATAAPAAAPAAGGTDLKLFEAGTDWKFSRNTGEGSMTLGKDDAGKAIGTVQYDFSKSSAKTTPYVLASAEISVAGGSSAISIMARSDVPQQLTFRLVDVTGQTLQYKTRINGTGSWEAIRISLTGKLEHWDGANDGKTHFPIKSLVLSIPLPNPDHKIGKVEFAAASAL
jgi:hypothetical protein